jgi:hypothetical protein
LETSGVALLHASSGLERLMVGSAAAGVLKDSNVAQISAFLYYQANVAARLESNKAFQRLFKTTIFNQIEKDFGLFIDSQARTKPKSLHHVYELTMSLSFQNLQCHQGAESKKADMYLKEKLLLWKRECR